MAGGNKFISTAKRSAADIRQFLKEAASDGTMKYKAQAGQTHVLYFPFEMATVKNEETGAEEQVKRLIAISGDVHEWNDSDGKYHACICLKDIVREDENGNKLNDGTCPFCNRVSDGWSIYRHRVGLEEARCDKVGQERDKFLEGVRQTILKERKASEARPYVYILVAQIQTAPGMALGQTQPVLDENGLPKFELKFMKLSAKRAESIETSIANSNGESMADSEIAITYPNIDDQRQIVQQSTIAPMNGQVRFTTRYPDLKQRILNEAKAVDLDAIEGSFREWEGMTTDAATKTMDDLFRKWDEYQVQLKLNPSAQYMEYGLPPAGPALSGQGVGIPAAGVGVGVGVGVGAGVAQPQFTVPGQAPTAQPTEQPVATLGQTIPDANAVFGQGGTNPVPEGDAGVTI